MLKHRLIPCVLLKDWQLTKSVKFKDFRTIGHPKVTAKIYNTRNVDELIVLDIDASKKGEQINYQALKQIADECFMPLTVGGGIESIDQVEKLFSIGADKIALNTSARKCTRLVSDIAVKYGSQSIVVSVDVVNVNGRYHIVDENAVALDIPLIDYLADVQTAGAGEILITSVERDGTQAGYDIELLKLINEHISVPLILNGGAGKPSHFLEPIKMGVSALAAASIFHFTQYTPNDVKRYLCEHGVPVRNID